MWSRAQLKGRAKATFKRNYWKCILISLLLTLIAGGSGAASGNLSSATGSLHGSENQAGSSYDYDSGYDSDDGSLRDFEAGLEQGSDGRYGRSSDRHRHIHSCFSGDFCPYTSG